MGHKSKRFKKTTDVQIQITDFKSSFKYFKRRDPPPDFDRVVDLQNVRFNQCFEKILPQQSDLVIENANDVTQWSINKLLSNPGITIIQNVFSSSHLKYWASRCIKVKWNSFFSGLRKVNWNNYCPDFLLYPCNY